MKVEVKLGWAHHAENKVALTFPFFTLEDFEDTTGAETPSFFVVSFFRVAVDAFTIE